MEMRTCAKDAPSDAVARFACQLYGLCNLDNFASASSEKDGFLNVNGLVRCILCSGVSSTGGLGMILMCENGPVLAATFKEAGAGGLPGLGSFVRLALRVLRSSIAQTTSAISSSVRMHALMSHLECFQEGLETHDEVVYQRGLLLAEEES